MNPMASSPLTVSVLLQVDPARAWAAYTEPQAIVQWNFASEDWHCPRAENDVRVGGRLCSRMEAKDGSMGFDFEGVYTEVQPLKRLAYRFGERHAQVVFASEAPHQTWVRVTFEPENEYPLQQQQAGWQAILDNYQRFAERSAATLTAGCDMAATPSQVFAALADPARLARWWGPDGFSNTFEVFEFVPGGRWVFTMHGPDGQDYPNASVFERIEPDREVVIRHVVAPLFTLTVRLQPQGQGTHVHWAQTFDDPTVAEALRPVCEPSNAQNLARLAAEVMQARSA